MMKSVFLIKTPLQLLNAVEARHFFDLKEDDCVLIIMGDRKSQPQILALATHMNEWGRILVLNEVPLFGGQVLQSDGGSSFINKLWQSKLFSKSIFYPRRLNRISRELGSVKYIFIGYARYVYMRHFVNITPHEKVVLLDDGNATIQLAKERKQGFVSSPVGFKRKLKLFSKKYLQGIKGDEKEDLCFFTIYDVSLGENDQLVKNNYEYIRSSVHSLAVRDEVYFLGSPISETGILTRDEYLKHLRRVKKYFGNKKLIYIAHRRESAENLSMIAQELNIDVELFDYPIEYQLAIVGPRPMILASFISSALDNCGMILGDKLKVISFRLDLETSPVRDVIESIYDSYEADAGKNMIVETEY